MCIVFLICSHFLLCPTRCVTFILISGVFRCIKMISSDEESLAGLTQVPSQKHDSEENLKLTDADDLIDCTANAEVDFDNFVDEFMPSKKKLSTSPKLHTEKHDTSMDLFVTPPSTVSSFDTVGNETLPSSVSLLVCMIGL